MFEILCDGAAGSSCLWQKVGDWVVGGLVVLLTYKSGLRAWKKQKEMENGFRVRSLLSDRRIEGMMGLWSLLGYMTEVENSKSIVVFEKRADGSNVYFMRAENGRAYMERLSEMFYVKGYGLFVDKEVKELLYEYRNMVYGVLLKEQKNGGSDGLIELENKDMRLRMVGIYNELNWRLRDGVG